MDQNAISYDIPTYLDAASDVEGQRLLDHPNLAESEHQRTPLLVKVTGYRLLTTAVVTGLGVPKAIASYQGESVVPTTLDWVAGVAATVLLYWIGLFETVEPPVLTWLLHDDYGPWVLKLVRVVVLSLHVAIYLTVPLFFTMNVLGALTPLFLSPINNGDLSAIAWIKFFAYLFLLPPVSTYLSLWGSKKITFLFRKHASPRVKRGIRRAVEIGTLDLQRYRVPGSNWSSAWDEVLPIFIGLALATGILVTYAVTMWYNPPSETPQIV
ncbi:hypothetical protein BV25DRAFT_1917116 [Artomyces pyxidatus]|uniref:Uncharacterized protein n=1 Tax=Artomyces pyxidatus TaxID=48021 RepID=A0ACB8SZA1_9AGAM|nr:hypothetical protein BV25DRAFT_1917116 [Artomyces pyxidatus]